MENFNFNNDYKEGFLNGAEEVKNEIIRCINNHTWVTPSDKKVVTAQLNLVTRYLLQKRKIIPTYIEKKKL